MYNSINNGSAKPLFLNSADVVHDAASSVAKEHTLDHLNLPPSVSALIHGYAFVKREYKMPPLAPLTWKSVIKSALLTIITLGIWLYRQHSHFHDALHRGDLEAADEARKNHGWRFSSVTPVELLEKGQVASAAFLMKINPYDSLQGMFTLFDPMEVVPADSADYLEYYYYKPLEPILGRPQNRENYQNTLTALLLANAPNTLLRPHFFAALQRNDYETAELFFQYGKTCKQLIISPHPVLVRSENIRFLLEHGFQPDLILAGDHPLDRNTLLWHCVVQDNLEGAKLLLAHATPAQRAVMLSTNSYNPYNSGTVADLVRWKSDAWKKLFNDFSSSS